MRTPLRIAATALALVVVACGSAQPGPALSLPPPGKLPRSSTSHVVVMVMENKERPQVIGSHSAPYTTRLAHRYASPLNLFGIRHPSLPNYLALVGGQTFGVSSDCTDCNVDAPNLADQLEAVGSSWKSYAEGMPSPCFKGASSGGYAKKHDPFMYFDRIRDDDARCARIVPFGQLSTDLRHGALPDFALISPDLCHSTHDCSVKTGDRFVAGVVPQLLHEIGPHGFLVLTYDEGESDRGCCGNAQGGRIPVVVAGPDVRRHGKGSGSYSTYSILRTVEDAFGVPRLGHAGDASTRGLGSLFRRSPAGRLRRSAH